jgi:putative restriction endonuclease
VDLDEELGLRQRVMDRLAAITVRNGGWITRDELSAMPIDGTTRRLIDTTKGIWNPRDLAATLSVVSSPSGPYDDREVEGGMVRYDYRAGSLQGDNAKLRRAMEMNLPIIFLRKIEPGVYVPTFPVFVVGDDVDKRQFLLALDESLLLLADPLNPTTVQRRYAERIVKARLHQPEFRARVIRAYATRCAVCSLQHADLLDAAHIIGDGEDSGHPVVSNGLSLCKLHHAAYDRDLMGISPDLTVHINRQLLEEIDGPMLEHGLKEMHGRSIAVPRRRAEHPDRDRLSTRFRRFVEA